MTDRITYLEKLITDAMKIANGMVYTRKSALEKLAEEGERIKRKRN